jgi:hypothetical protein
MSAAANGKDALASRAKPRREARACERGRHATLGLRQPDRRSRARSARRRAIDLADTLPAGATNILQGSQP